MAAEKQTDQWLTVDEGWGRRAVDFATLPEPVACREYVAMHHHLEVGAGDRLVAIACDRVPGADVRAGDMAALPFPCPGDGSSGHS